MFRIRDGKIKEKDAYDAKKNNRDNNAKNNDEFVP